MKDRNNELKENKRVLKVFPPQDFKRGQMWYAVQFNGEVCLLNSSKELFGLNDRTILENEGLSPVNTQVDMFLFSGTGIDRFLSGNDRVDFTEVFKKVHSFVRKYVFIRNEKLYTYIALWVIGTYFFRIFRYYPYIHINAPKGSGKTTLMDVMSRLAFNARTVNSINGPGVYRWIEASGVTLFIDEFETMNNNLNKELMQILNSGFQISGAVPRLEKQKNDNYSTPTMYSTYSPKVFSGINSIYNVLADRCIKIPMLKMLKSEKVARFKENEELSVYLDDLRDDLYILGLKYGLEIAEAYHGNIIESILPDLLRNRELDLWEGILILALQVSNDTLDTMLELALETVKDRSQENIMNDLNYRLIKDLEEAVNYMKPTCTKGDALYYANDALLNELWKVDPGLKKYIGTTTKLTQFLGNKLGVERKSFCVNGDTCRTYKLGSDVIAELKERFVVCDEEVFDLRHFKEDSGDIEVLE